ncbi:Alpha/beta hydrolase family-domain-containing protein [Boletus edulis BED1]|uniref:Alpha/beta hydrolase family-domain-containing protein n=1 Tax=Boletus edulis BED1 TaxID=1328754 RepID=A0AAD4C8H4_BOLED|nr:Alpha/beta hydrolase family-domain-containing protein [Boletus edulis BED1]
MGPSTTINSDFRVFSKNYVFDPRPHLPFRISAKRYWTHSDLEECTNGKTNSNPDDDKIRAEMLTLVFAHANGFHKEHWEPIIHRLFEQQWASEQCPFRIQDMWALDAPNHGDAAVMNEEVLAWGYSLFSWEDYARCVHAFLAGLGSGVDVDFSKRNLVAVGHSMGATAAILSTTFFPSIKFSSMHLIEPVMVGNHDPPSHLVDGAENRRDIWKSVDDAYVALKSRSTWQNWDDRILKIYVEHGLRPLPTAEYPDRKDGVTLKCTRKQEAAVFRDHRSYTVAYRLLPYILKKTPTHITYGETADFLRDEWRHDVLNNASGGIRNFASVTWVPGAGHLVAQTKPDKIANVIWKSLLHTHSSGQIRSAAGSARL